MDIKYHGRESHGEKGGGWGQMWCVIAAGSGIREIARLRKRYGRGRWRKRKGIADIRLQGGAVFKGEVHWYEATGIGKREFKIKRLL